MTTPTVVAHRGFAGQYPENTVAAVQAAAADGADAVEIDVQATADGDVVVFHDRRLDGRGESRGITDGTGVVWRQSTATVTGARVLGTDERVPTLEAVLSAVPAHVTVNVELKNPGSDATRPATALDADARERATERWAPFVESVVGVVDQFGADVVYSSFYEGAISALRTRAPDAPVAVLVAPDSVTAGCAVARRYDVDAVNLPLSAVDGASGDRLAGVAADLDASRNVWTVEDWQDARRAVDSGAGGIIADYAGLDSYVRP
ncbi:glycerophosphodiester phosphodiesterase [Halomicroarcula sp. F13]|uniref:Glycerophosphodiester phosphodiesterase n=1 Tax=Haloarcula rubra TaxID=2487747 RepID=A0AAW4PRB6_9EURY|nr:glycerophosphodiester phosphodiesterase [Halomicroarcula rubra]MBX0323090.1 glycerophosphodiester phosphodiesterase [Halomicroarcula rubra]